MGSGPGLQVPLHVVMAFFSCAPLHCSTPSLKCKTQPQSQLRLYQRLTKQKGNPYMPDPGCFPLQWLYSAGQQCQCLFRLSEIMGIWKNPHCTNPIVLSCRVFPPPSFGFCSFATILQIFKCLPDFPLDQEGQECCSLPPKPQHFSR